MRLLRIGNHLKSGLKTAFRLFCIGSRSGTEGMATTYDEARESRIQALTDLLKRAVEAKHWEEARRLQAEWKAATLARSAAQIERMEQAARQGGE